MRRHSLRFFPSYRWPRQSGVVLREIGNCRARLNGAPIRVIPNISVVPVMAVDAVVAAAPIRQAEASHARSHALTPPGQQSLAASPVRTTRFAMVHYARPGFRRRGELRQIDPIRGSQSMDQRKRSDWTASLTLVGVLALASSAFGGRRNQRAPNLSRRGVRAAGQWPPGDAPGARGAVGSAAARAT